MDQSSAVNNKCRRWSKHKSKTTSALFREGTLQDFVDCPVGSNGLEELSRVISIRLIRGDKFFTYLFNHWAVEFVEKYVSPASTVPSQIRGHTWDIQFWCFTTITNIDDPLTDELIERLKNGNRLDTVSQHFQRDRYWAVEWPWIIFSSRRNKLIENLKFSKDSEPHSKRWDLCSALTHRYIKLKQTFEEQYRFGFVGQTETLYQASALDVEELVLKGFEPIASLWTKLSKATNNSWFSAHSLV